MDATAVFFSTSPFTNKQPAMGIRFACHVCSKKLNIKRELAGRRGICPSCSAKFRIPMHDAEQSAPLEVETRVASRSQDVAQVSSSADPADIRLADDEPDATWYVRPPSGGQYGPASSEVLKQWVAEGRVAATALLWRDGWPQWRDAENVLPELAASLPGSSSPSNWTASFGRATATNAAATESGGSSTGLAVLKRPKVRQQLRLIGAIAGLALLLVAVLVFAMIRG